MQLLGAKQINSPKYYYKCLVKGIEYSWVNSKAKYITIWVRDKVNI